MTAELQDRLAQAVEIAWLQAIDAVRVYVSGKDMANFGHLSYVGSKGQVGRLLDIIENDEGCKALRVSFRGPRTLTGESDEPGDDRSRDINPRLRVRTLTGESDEPGDEQGG